MHHHHGRRRRVIVLHEAGFPWAGRVNTALQNFLRCRDEPPARPSDAASLYIWAPKAGKPVVGLLFSPLSAVAGRKQPGPRRAARRAAPFSPSRSLLPPPPSSPWPPTVEHGGPPRQARAATLAARRPPAGRLTCSLVFHDHLPLTSRQLKMHARFSARESARRRLGVQSNASDASAHARAPCAALAR